MATYKEIKGVTVQTRDSDPVLNVGSWSSGGSLNTPRGQIAGFGTIPAAGAAQGATPAGGPPGVVGYYEQYNGTAWTETTDINTAGRNGLGTGTTTAGLVYGGWPRGGATETWNGSAWTEVGDMTRGANASQSQAGGGTQTAAFAAGGEPGTTYFQLVETWNGSAWTEVNDLNTGRQAAQGFGITTAGYVASGYSPPVGSPYITGNVEVYNGSSWTETTNVNTNRGQGGGAGNSTSGIIYTGSTGPGGNYTANTESWNGSAWTELNDVSTARAQMGKTPNPTSGSTDALAIGGEVPGYTAVTEEWSFPPPTAAILTEGDIFLSGGTTLKGFGKAAGIPSGSWGSAGNLNTARGDGMYGFGTTSAAGIAGGDDGTPGDSWVGNTEIYNGSSWSEQADLNTARYFAIGSGGTTTAAIGVAGRAGPSNLGNVESWNGSAWTETTDINTTRRGVLSTQPPAAQTQIVVYSGYTTTQLANTESWDGSTWTELSDLNSARYTGGDGGSGPGDAICAGGQPNSPGKICEFWDGTSWSEGADLNTIRIEGAASGATSTSVIYGGGNNPGGTGLDTVEYYNGSSWTEIADLADGGNGASHHIGSAHDTFFAGGISPTTPNAASASTEHFTADNTLADITVS